MEKGSITMRREVVAVCMESPLYFTMPLQKRLDLLKLLERQTYWSRLRDRLKDILENRN